MAANREAGGTLCRMIPLDRIAGRIVKWRVEVGDLGVTIGTVMKAVGGRSYEAFFIRPGSTDTIKSTLEFLYPEDAALALAATYWMAESPTLAEQTPRRPLASVPS